MAKQPGLDRHGLNLREVALDVSLSTEAAGQRRRIAYERLLLDLIEGDPELVRALFDSMVNKDRIDRRHYEVMIREKPAQ